MFSVQVCSVLFGNIRRYSDSSGECRCGQSWADVVRLDDTDVSCLVGFGRQAVAQMSPRTRSTTSNDSCSKTNWNVPRIGPLRTLTAPYGPPSSLTALPGLNAASRRPLQNSQIPSPPLAGEMSRSDRGGVLPQRPDRHRDGEPPLCLRHLPRKGGEEEFFKGLVMVKPSRLRDGSRTKEGDRLSRLARVPETMRRSSRNCPTGPINA